MAALQRGGGGVAVAATGFMELDVPRAATVDCVPVAGLALLA
ncbi:hypothetical protein SSE37_12476 [Sagittula stellata E-37]|uniref:Uncharacterized protein n=1 Tax=Sagittula stellata (strain ATCC 700073 / DSM 11524 / E-37) TaxID=388399 RepID=A3K6N4_SAGS3|nr:hypothetical protein SSE37_12476 [Sagittula stellata E-37]